MICVTSITFSIDNNVNIEFCLVSEKKHCEGTIIMVIITLIVIFMNINATYNYEYYNDFDEATVDQN